MEVIAGEQSTETEVVQHGSRFLLDFAKVYWNSRLETEHLRLVRSFGPQDVVVDMMAGIGPFAIPAAQKGCQVYANDLNPESFRYLTRNSTINKVQSKVHAFNMDGREFVRLLLNRLKRTDEAPKGNSVEGQVGPSNSSCTPAGFEPPMHGLVFQHVVMNLPASAIEFLDVFQGLFDPGTWRDHGHELPWIHVYTFKKGTETEDDIVAKAEGFLGGKMDRRPDIHVVRDVAPNKLMLCLSFQLPEDIAFPSKRQKS